MPSIPQSLLWISLVVLWLFVLVPMLINKRDTVRRTSDVALATRVLNTKSRLIRRSGPAAGHRHDPTWQREESGFDSAFDEDSHLETFEDRRMAEARTEEFVFPPAGFTAEAYSAEAYSAEVYSETYSEAYSAEILSEEDDEAPVRGRTRSLVVIAAVTEHTDPNYLDVDIVDEDSGALPVGGIQGSLFDPLPEPESSADAEAEPVAGAADAEPVADAEPEPLEDIVEPVDEVQQPEPQPQPEPAEFAEPAGAGADSRAGDEFEYVDDSSGLEDAEEPDRRAAPSRRRRLDSSATAAAVTARKYRFRKRVLMGMTALAVLTTVLSLTVDSSLWWACGATGGVTVLYLAYLRRQTRIEEQVRRRRQQRAPRSRAGEETVAERVVHRDRPDFDVVPTRLQRPGSVVLDIDDEDPIFEHLDEVPYSRRHYDLPRAAGQ